MALSGPAKTVAQTVSVVVLMGGLAWASVPFYDWFCRVTGYGGETNVAAANEKGVLDQTIKVRFDANVERGFPWTFKPETREMEIRIGETGLAFYEATKHCIKYYGTSDIEFAFDPETPVDQLPRDGDRIVLRGTCQE